MAESIFTSQTPANPNHLEPGSPPVTLGTLFTVATNGTIDGGRWLFPTTLPSGTVTWTLYQWNSDASGTQLAQASFSSPTAGVWNTVSITPVNIVSGQRYVTTVHTPNGRYVFTGAFFASSGVTNGNLTAPQDDSVTPARNGRFVGGASPAFPTNTFNATCYFADVLFTAAGAATGIAVDSAIEVDSAFAISPLSGSITGSIGLATETDVAFPVSVLAGALNIPVDRASETSTAFAISPLVSAVTGSVGLATETDTALPITVAAAPITGAVGSASETDVAFGITPIIGTAVIPMGMALETDIARPIPGIFSQTVAINRANETDAALPINVRVTGARTPFNSGPCEDWEPIWCADLSPAAMEVTGMAVTLATQVLWQASGQRFGLCQVTLRPCRNECAEGYPTFESRWPGAGGQAYGLGGGPRPYWLNGLWANVCGSCAGTCSCTMLDEALLPAPVREVVEVRMDGVVMDPSLYRVDENRKLVRTDQQMWPMCQDMSKDDTEDGTWSVTITVGEDVPALGRRAVGELAAEFAKDCAGEACQVPYDITSLSRQGVNLSYGSPNEEDTAPGFLGLRMVRLFIGTYNAQNLRHRGKVYDIDKNPRPWRRTNTS